MIYYLCIKDKEPLKIGETTLGGTLLADEGWVVIKNYITNYENVEKFSFTIKDQKDKSYHLYPFLEKIGKAHIIER